MSTIHLYIHVVFAVKKRMPALIQGKRKMLFDHIAANAKANHINLQQIGGHDDHVHILLELSSTQCVARIVQIIKGESAWWANHTGLFENKLVWSKRYYARTIDPDNISTVKKYISGQHKHEQFFTYLNDYMNALQTEK